MSSNSDQRMETVHQCHNTRNQAALDYKETDLWLSQSAVSSCVNSSLTRLKVPKLGSPYSNSLLNRCGRVSFAKKRKSEFLSEEEQSEMTTKTEGEFSTNTCSKASPVNQKPDYIHVRARRGQATDSHSLAERARREKISKKMKCLQDLVPSCDKVTGKAGVLDEIINYVQSLQNQVEFLSMKLAALNPRVYFSFSDFLTKQPSPYSSSFPKAAVATRLDSRNSTFFQCNRLQLGSNSGSDIRLDQFQMIPQDKATFSLPTAEMFLDSSNIPQLQQLPIWDSEWQNLLGSGFSY